jgi:hypothetical protein
MMIFWVETPCGLVGTSRYQRFGRTCCLLLYSWWPLQRWRWRQYVPPKRWYLPTSVHSISAQKTNINIFTAVRNSNFLQVAYVVGLWRQWECRIIFFKPVKNLQPLFVRPASRGAVLTFAVICQLCQWLKSQTPYKSVRFRHFQFLLEWICSHLYTYRFKSHYCALEAYLHTCCSNFWETVVFLSV